MSSIRNIWAAALVAASLVASGCGSSSHRSASAGAGAGGGAAASSGGAPSSGGGGAASASAGAPAALSAEARSAATGDIPDNQVFLVFHDNGAAYSIKYPEGWTQRGGGANVTFQDKNNLVHIVIGHGGTPSVASVASQLIALKRTTPTLAFTAPHPIQIGSAQAVKTTYTTQSAPNPVTGKRVTLIVDRYALARNGRVAVMDLGTPRGVDNVDAYRMVIESFHWR